MSMTANSIGSSASQGDPVLRAVVFDYGGVITNPLVETMVSFCGRMGVEPPVLAEALGRVGAEWGEAPMARLEVARCTEAELVAAMLAHLPRLGTGLAGRTFGEHWFRGRHSEPTVLALIAEVRASGLLTGLLTNNVREWRPRWRAQLDETLFDVVVDSSVEGVRKPDPEIYLRTVERLGVPAQQCLFVDDVAANRDTAAAVGMRVFPWVDRTSVDALRAAIAAGRTHDLVTSRGAA